MRCEICLFTYNKEDLVECSVCGRLVCPDCIAFDDLCVDCYEEEETSWLDEPFWHFY